jgi:hypothetical protein
MEHQLYMYGTVRESLLERHRFFIREVRSRVLSRFADVEGEARKFAAEYERIGQKLQEGDQEAGAEFAYRRGGEYYELLYDMKVDMELAAVAAMFHRWDKDLRDFLERELNHTIDLDISEDIAWSPDAIATFKLLEEFGWDCKSQSFYDRIINLRLVVNVYKHGKGRSLNDLATLCPQYLQSKFATGTAKGPDYQDLTVTVDQFDELAAAIEAFWKCFPERLFVK